MEDFNFNKAPNTGGGDSVCVRYIIVDATHVLESLYDVI